MFLRSLIFNHLREHDAFPELLLDVVAESNDEQAIKQIC